MFRIKITIRRRKKWSFNRHHKLSLDSLSRNSLQTRLKKSPGCMIFGSHILECHTFCHLSRPKSTQKYIYALSRVLFFPKFKDKRWSEVRMLPITVFSRDVLQVLLMKTVKVCEVHRCQENSKSAIMTTIKYHLRTWLIDGSLHIVDSSWKKSLWKSFSLSFREEKNHIKPGHDQICCVTKKLLRYCFIFGSSKTER